MGNLPHFCTYHRLSGAGQSAHGTREERQLDHLSCLPVGSRRLFTGLFCGRAKSEVENEYIIHYSISLMSLTFFLGLPRPRPLVGGALVSPSGPLECFYLMCV